MHSTSLVSIYSILNVLQLFGLSLSLNVVDIPPIALNLLTLHLNLYQRYGYSISMHLKLARIQIVIAGLSFVQKSIQHVLSAKNNQNNKHKRIDGRSFEI